MEARIAENVERKIIVAVDFDGTICENKFPQIGAIRQGSIDILKQLQSDGVVLILWTCRDGLLAAEAIDFCAEHGFIFDHVNENWAGLPFETSNKIYADFYIDDKAIGHQWDAVIPQISNFEKDTFIIVE